MPNEARPSSGMRPISVIYSAQIGIASGGRTAGRSPNCCCISDKAECLRLIGHHEHAPFWSVHLIQHHLEHQEDAG